MQKIIFLIKPINQQHDRSISALYMETQIVRQ